MIVSDWLTKVSYALRGTDDDAPAFGDDEANYWLSILNDKKDELYQDVTQQWSNTFDSTRTVGTVSASSAPSFDFDDDFIAPSDSVYVLTTGGQKVYYDLVKAYDRNRSSRYAYISGMDPQTLYFNNAVIAGEDIIGGTLYVPGYYIPDDLTSAGDTLPFLNPLWGVYSVAADIAFNDIVYEDKAETLNNKANYQYGLMVKRNRRAPFANPRKTPTVVNRIRGVR